MRYSEQSRSLAASVVLEAAVAEAVALLKAGPIDRRPNNLRFEGRPVTVTYRYPNDSLDRAEQVLLSAAESAELVLGRAS